MNKITATLVGATPYEGYLGQVTGDYFFEAGLHGTHNAVFEGMDPNTKLAVQPYMPDYKPLSVLTPPLLRELPRATFGAWGNYLGDMYLGGGGVASTDARRRVAVGSTLIMAMLDADEATWRQSPNARDITSVTLSYAHMRSSITGEAKRLTHSSENLSSGPHAATQLLAQEVNRRVVGGNEDQKMSLATGVHGLADARHRQFTTGRSEICHMRDMALDLGEVTARMALGLTTLRPEVQAAPPNDEGEAAAIALGKIGAIITHSTRVDEAFRLRMPTFATAIIMDSYGPTKKALASIEEHRTEAVQELVKEGQDALRDGTRQSRGIFRMAVHLLRIRQGAGGIGSKSAINKHMSQDPYWSRYL